ncbi:hypothetical protein FHS29_002456 [Saccharothrix tamanrassetensis]|uniref:Uncharacterized protein n=1 Tax=Saccharothrix tamanrassetensis TaxID=1051531 RepID=A0A841CIP1_9PSEU|nr:hypothetical protein [Saccharothrix tamanrassetensis]MBB5955875.1 hypothetical protein [Saccharothrix tamanrassetensis]
MTAVLADDSAGEAQSDQPPSFTEAEFAALIQGMVTDNAPRVFAVVQEYGERQDARVGAWGMAFPERADVVSADGTFTMSLQRPEGALRAFEPPGVAARLVWVEGADAGRGESVR